MAISSRDPRTQILWLPSNASRVPVFPPADAKLTLWILEQYPYERANDGPPTALKMHMFLKALMTVAADRLRDLASERESCIVIQLENAHVMLQSRLTKLAVLFRLLLNDLDVLRRRSARSSPKGVTGALMGHTVSHSIRR